MKVRYKPTGEVFAAVQWFPGVEDPRVVKENPPTRGHPTGSGTVRGGGTLIPGEYMIGDATGPQGILSPDPSEWPDYEVVEDEETAADSKKLCPLLDEDCHEDKCAWWESDDGVCVVFKKLLD